MSAAEAGAGDVGNADGGAGRLTVPSAVFPRASIVDHRGSVVESISRLKGSISEGPNHSKFSDRSSVRILSKFRNFR